MSMASLDISELRRRLDVGSEVSDDVLTAVLAVTTQLVDPRCDLALVTANTDSYREGCYQLAVKVYDTQARGVMGMDDSGMFMAPTMQATSGMIRSVYGVLAPCMPTGGVGGFA